MTTTIKILLIALLILVIGGASYYAFTLKTPEPIEPPSTTTNGKESMVPFENTQQGITFSYPSSLYVTEKEVGTNEKPQHAIVMVKNTADNRAVIDGTVTEGREGPTAITIDIYPNPSGLSAREWVASDTNWTVDTREAVDTTVAGKPGITYSWSGLYEGKSYVIPHGNKVYVFAVTWMDPEEQLVRDFDMVLNSTEFK